MDSITITITRSDEGGYMYDIYTHDLEASAMMAEEETGSEDGGLCTTTLANAIGMAAAQAVTLARAANERQGKRLNVISDETGEYTAIDLEDDEDAEESLEQNGFSENHVTWSVQANAKRD